MEQGWGSWLLSFIPFVNSGRSIVAGSDVAGQAAANKAAKEALYADILSGKRNVTHGLAQGNTLGRTAEAVEGLATLGIEFSATAPGLAAGSGAFGRPTRSNPKPVSAATKGTEIILKNGYYEAGGMKISSYYYNRLWTTGRPAPFVVAREIIENGTKIGPHAAKPGFFRYELGNWEMIYNPATKEIWHLQPFK